MDSTSCVPVAGLELIARDAAGPAGGANDVEFARDVLSSMQGRAYYDAFCNAFKYRPCLDLLESPHGETLTRRQAGTLAEIYGVYYEFFNSALCADYRDYLGLTLVNTLLIDLVALFTNPADQDAANHCTRRLVSSSRLTVVKTVEEFREFVGRVKTHIDTARSDPKAVFIVDVYSDERGEFVRGVDRLRSDNAVTAMMYLVCHTFKPFRACVTGLLFIMQAMPSVNPLEAENQALRADVVHLRLVNVSTERTCLGLKNSVESYSRTMQTSCADLGSIMADLEQDRLDLVEKHEAAVAAVESKAKKDIEEKEVEITALRNDISDLTTRNANLDFLIKMMNSESRNNAVAVVGHRTAVRGSAPPGTYNSSMPFGAIGGPAAPVVPRDLAEPSRLSTKVFKGPFPKPNA